MRTADSRADRPRHRRIARANRPSTWQRGQTATWQVQAAHFDAGAGRGRHRDRTIALTVADAAGSWWGPTAGADGRTLCARGGIRRAERGYGGGERQIWRMKLHEVGSRPGSRSTAQYPCKMHHVATVQRTGYFDWRAFYDCM